MISKILIGKMAPFKHNSEINLKKFNLIIGKNGTGKTRVFKSLVRGNLMPQMMDASIDGLQHYMTIHDQKEIIGELYANEDSHFFTLLVNSILDYHYIPDKRSPYSSSTDNIKQNIFDLEKHLVANYLFNPDSLEFTTKMYKDIFDRVLHTRKTTKNNNTADRFFYRFGDDLIDPLEDGFGILQTLGIFQVLFMAPKSSTIIIEEPTANLHPSAIRPMLDRILSYAKSKNIQLVVITHDIAAASMFIEKIRDKDPDTTMHRFEQIDRITHIHNVDHDNWVASLDDFMGDYLKSCEVQLLRYVAGFNPDFLTNPKIAQNNSSDTISGQVPNPKAIQCSYALFFDIPNPHATIHRVDCTYYKQHGGNFTQDNGGWIHSDSLPAIQQIGRIIEKKLGLPMKTCGKCKI